MTTSQPGDELEATVAMPRVEPPPRPQPPPRRQLDPAIVEPASPPAAAPVSGTVIPPPTVTVVRAPFVFGSPVGYVLARFFAFVLDIALVGGVATSLMYSLIAINPITGLPTNSEQGFDATLALGIAVALVYVWIAEALFGTTIWKLTFGLHVYALRERRVGLTGAFLRNLLRPIDALIIGGVLALLPAHRRLGDYAGGTIVARSPLRGFAPVIGWVLVLVTCGVPYIVAPTRSFASLVAFYEFVPPIINHAWTALRALFP